MAFYLCIGTSRSVNFGVACFYSAVFTVFFAVALAMAIRHWFYAFWIAPVVTALVLLNVVYLAAVEPPDMTVGQAKFTEALLVLDAFLVPLYVLQLFELTFMVHRNRSVNFCCVRLEEVGSRRAKQRLLAVRLVARGLILALAALALVNQSLKVSGLSTEDILSQNLTLCSRGIFATYLYPEEDNEYFAKDTVEETLEVVVDLLQPLVLWVSAGYLGILLWRYGTFYAFRPSSTYLNPWVALSIFSIVFFIAMFFYTSFSAFTLALFFLQIACFLISKLVIDELRAFHDLDEYLRKSQQRSVSGSETSTGDRGGSSPSAQGYAGALVRNPTSSRVANVDELDSACAEEENGRVANNKVYARNAVAPHHVRVSRDASQHTSLRHSQSLPLQLLETSTHSLADPGRDESETSICLPAGLDRESSVTARRDRENSVTARRDRENSVTARRDRENSVTARLAKVSGSQDDEGIELETIRTVTDEISRGDGLSFDVTAGENGAILARRPRSQVSEATILDDEDGADDGASADDLLSAFQALQGGHQNAQQQQQVGREPSAEDKSASTMFVIT